MSRNFAMASAVALALGACSSLPPVASQNLPAGPSPVTFDGNVTGQALDYVFVLVADPDPGVAGLSMRAGDVMVLKLPEAFKRNETVAIKPDSDANLVFTKGWPQAAVKQAGQYRIGYDEKANAMTVTALQDIANNGANAPGIKVIHLRGRSFLNPFPGDYPVAVEYLNADGRQLAAWSGTIKVQEDAPRARLAPTNFHLAPGSNSDFQIVAPGQVAPRMLGVLLWGEAGSPLNNIGIAPRDLGHYPRYTGGLLIQDTNGDKVLDPAVDKVVGGIIGAAPAGAKGQSATSPLGGDGKPILSGEVARNAGFPAAIGGGKPNPGLLAIQFRAGDQPGLYRPTIELIGGNGYQFTIKAAAEK